MKAKLLVVGLIGLVSVAGAEIINWNGAFPVAGGAPGDVTQLYMSDAVLTGTWYNDVSIDTFGVDVSGISVALVGAESVLAASTAHTSIAGLTVPGPVSDAPAWLFTVVFNTAGDQFKVLDQTAYSVPASSGLAGTPVATYTVGLLSGGQGSEWTTVVPEPATLGMMAVAGLGMFLARKKARR